MGKGNTNKIRLPTEDPDAAAVGRGNNAAKKDAAAEEHTSSEEMETTAPAALTISVVAKEAAGSTTARSTPPPPETAAPAHPPQSSTDLPRVHSANTVDEVEMRSPRVDYGSGDGRLDSEHNIRHDSRDETNNTPSQQKKRNEQQQRSTTLNSGGVSRGLHQQHRQRDSSFASSTNSVINASISGAILHPSTDSRNASPRHGASVDDDDEIDDDSLEAGGRNHHQRTGTIFGLTFNTLTNVMGAGVLSLPYATYNGSIVVSMLLLLLCSTLSAFAIFSLTLACEVTQKFSYTECLAFTVYPDKTLREGPTDDNMDEGITLTNEQPPRKRRRFMMLLIESIIFLNGFGTLTIYGRVIADSMPPVMSSFLGLEGRITETWLWLIVPAIMFFGLSCIRSMEELKWTSIVGFVTILYIVLIVIWRFFSNIFWPVLPQFGEPGYSEADLLKQQELRYFRLGFSCFSTLASYSLAYAYHFNVPYFYFELKDRRPATMMRGTAVSFPIITASYAATGLFGYFTFGALVGSSHAMGNIVKNYRSDDTLINLGRLGLFFHFATVYPIISICCRRGLHRIVCVVAASSSSTNNAVIVVNGVEVPKPPPGDPSTTRTTSIIIEAFFIVLGTTLCAALAPGIGVVVELVGTLFGTPLVFIFPGLIGLCVFHDDIPIVQHTMHAVGYPSHTKWLYRLSFASVVMGSLFVACGMTAILSEWTTRGTRESL